MRPIFCGNFEYDTRQSDLERLFSKYGRVERVDMKSGTFSRVISFPGVLSFILSAVIFCGCFSPLDSIKSQFVP